MSMTSTLEKIPVGMQFKAVPTGGRKQIRCLKEEDGNIFVFAKGSHKYGRRYTETSFEMFYRAIEPKDPEIVWKRNLQKAIGKLEESGLWPDILSFYRDLLQMSLEDLKDIRTRFWERKRLRDETIETRNALWGPHLAKYPFAFELADDGDWELKTNYLYELADCKLKTMYFGKRENEFVKDQIRQALEEKKDFNSGKCEAGYDVSFSYRADKCMAWYSEEYRGCGNGHYYLALNQNTAVFYEND